MAMRVVEHGPTAYRLLPPTTYHLPPTAYHLPATISPMHPNPYGKYIEGRDPLRSLDETAARIASMVRAWPRSKDDESYAPGKWTARQILEHLVHLEMVF